MLTSALQAQCPTQIFDVEGNGNTYLLTIASAAQCAAIPNGTPVTINSGNYQVADCGDLTGNGTPIQIQLTFNTGTPVVLATTALVSFTFGMTTCTYNNMGVLPIELLSFKGKALETSNLLTWRTASERQNKGFEIEASPSSPNPSKGGELNGGELNGGELNEWRTIGFVAGHGTTNKEQRYTFEDKSPLWGFRGYYRLKQLDEDGRFEYSNVITITRKGDDNVVLVFPNPSNGVFTLSGLENIEDEQISIVNSIGQNIAITIQNDGQMDLSAYPSGVYYLRIASSGQVVKVVLEHGF
jgi:hypothetical protein